MGHNLIVELNDSKAKIVFLDCGENESETGNEWECTGLLQVDDVFLGYAKVSFSKDRLKSIMEEMDYDIKFQIYPKEEETPK